MTEKDKKIGDVNDLKSLPHDNPAGWARLKLLLTPSSIEQHLTKEPFVPGDLGGYVYAKYFDKDQLPLFADVEKHVKRCQFCTEDVNELTAFILREASGI